MKEKTLQQSVYLPCAACNSERCYLEGGACDERLPTAGTGVLGPAGRLVQLLVRAPMAALRKLPPAVSTRIGTLTRVDAPMLHQQLTPGKEFPAIFTTMALRDWSGLRRLAHQICSNSAQQPSPSCNRM